MKLKNLFITLGLAAVLGIGVGAGLAAKQDVKETKADTLPSTIYFTWTGSQWESWEAGIDYLHAHFIDGDGNGIGTWQGDDELKDSVYVEYSKTYAAFDVPSNAAKVVFYVYGTPGWSYNDWEHKTQDLTIPLDGKDRFTMEVRDESTDWRWNGSWSSAPAVYSVIFSVDFDSEVPEYADIYIPGDFNGWSENVAVSKMERVTNTSFTYALAEIPAGTYAYKVVACYSGAAAMDWNHEIDATNQSVTIVPADDQTTKVLPNRDYDFATKMPEQKAADGAHVTLTFASEVPVTLDIIYVGGLTQWGKSVADMNKGKMTANAARTVFTWDLPANTYVGTYKYKIVAMSKYTTATEVNYDHLVYGVKATDEELVVDTTTTNYPLTANDYDLSYIAAYAMAEGFINDMQGVCGTTEGEWGNDHSGTTLNTKWATWKEVFEALTEGAQQSFGTSNDAFINRARTLYAHCVARYALDTWTGAPAAQARVSMTIINSDTMIYVVIAAFAAISACGLFFVIKRRKHAER